METAKISAETKSRVPTSGLNSGQAQSGLFKMVHNNKGLKKTLISQVPADIVLNSK